MSRGRASPVLAWSVALAGAAAALAVLEYRTRDPDSVLHTQIVAGIAARPVAEWIAPEWPSGWYMKGLYREHPVGIALLPAALARLGYPAEQSAYAVNALYQVLALVLIQRVAAAFADSVESRALGWLVQLLPIAFTYRIRANHEPAVLLFLLAALFATERSRTRPGWAALTAAALSGMTLVKGVFALAGPAACALWLLVRGRDGGKQRGAWLGLVLATTAIPATALAYDSLYRAATGEPFVAFYLSRQLGVSAEAHSEAFWSQKAYNVVWYLARLVWFAFPWSLAVAAAIWPRKPVAASASVPPENDEAARRSERARQGLRFVVGLALLYLVTFSLSDRKADRYVFPAYYALGAGGAVAALRGWPSFRRFAERVDRLGPLVPVAVWVVTFGLHLAGGRLHLPRIKVWPSD